MIDGGTGLGMKWWVSVVRGGRDALYEQQLSYLSLPPYPCCRHSLHRHDCSRAVGWYLAPTLPSSPRVNENQLATELCILPCILFRGLTPLLPPRGGLHTAAPRMSFSAPQTLPQEAGNARHFPSP